MKAIFQLAENVSLESGGLRTVVVNLDNYINENKKYKSIIVTNKKEQGDLKCGGGPVICYGPAVQNNVRDFILDVAEKNTIAIQRQAVSRSTGTDTDSFAYATEGVASALISLPLKYMHTTVETVHKEDVQAVINLIYQSLLALRGDEDWRYIK